MLVTKNGTVLELENASHIAAFLGSGWEEYKEPEKVEKPKAKPAKK